MKLQVTRSWLPYVSALILSATAATDNAAATTSTLGLTGKRIVHENSTCAGWAFVSDTEAVRYDEVVCAPADEATAHYRIRWISSSSFVLVEKKSEPSAHEGPPLVYLYELVSADGQKVKLNSIWTGWEESLDSSEVFNIRGTASAVKTTTLRDEDHGCSVEIAQSAFVPPKGWSPEKGGFWSTDLGTPRNCISKMTIDFQGRKVESPSAAISDLCDAHTVEVTADAAKCEVKLDGGDGAGSYDAWFNIDSGGLKNRIVEDGEKTDDMRRVQKSFR